MTIASEKTSVSLLVAPLFKTSGADHCTPPAHRVTLPDEAEDAMVSSSGIVVRRLKPAKQALPLSSIRIFDLGARSALRRE